MTETIPLEGPLKEHAKEGVERLLLAPVFLIYEIVAVLFPGVLFLILLLAKGNHSVVAALQASLLGYKTKLFVALVLGYLAGKVFSIPTDGLREYASERFWKEVNQTGSKRLPDLAKRFVVGAFLLPKLFAVEHVLDYIVLSLMNVSFNTTTGTVLLVSSLIPGDHFFRWIEFASGALLLIRGYKGLRTYWELIVSMLGITHSDSFRKLFPGGFVDAFEAALKLAASNSKPEPPAIAPGAPPPLPAS